MFLFTVYTPSQLFWKQGNISCTITVLYLEQRKSSLLPLKCNLAKEMLLFSYHIPNSNYLSGLYHQMAYTATQCVFEQTYVWVIDYLCSKELRSGEHRDMFASKATSCLA